MATIDTVKEVLSENLDIDADQITEEATMEALGIDSLDMMELICDLEEKCEIEFGEPEGIETIGQLVSIGGAALAAPFSAFRPNGAAPRIVRRAKRADAANVVAPRIASR